MEQYIKKSALVTEIEKRAIEAGLHDGVIAETKEDECYSILSLINTLEVKEVDLDKELSYEDYMDFFKKYPDLSDDWGFDECWIFAKHFFELGLRSTITEEDCKLIWNIGDEIPNMPEEEFFKELLRRYKAQKGE